MAEKQEKIILEREYTVNLRKKCIKTPRYKRANKAVKSLKQFIAKHMKVEDRDLRKVKLDKWLNNEMWKRGIQKPLMKVKVKVKKFDNGIVKVELAEIPEFIKFKIEREKKLAEVSEKKVEKKEEKEKKKTEEEKKEEAEKEEEKEEKKEATVEAGLMKQQEKSREIKHEIVDKKGIKKPLARMALKK